MRAPTRSPAHSNANNQRLTPSLCVPFYVRLLSYWFICLAAVLAMSLQPTSRAANATWKTAPADGTFSNGNNWSTGSAPGSTSTTTNTDVATFNDSNITAITVDANRNLKTITFDLAASAYTFSSGSFRLTSAGAITLASTFSGSANTVETFNTSILLLANGSFTNASSIAGTSLTFAGPVSQDSTVTAARTLTVDGAGNGQISGVITNGTGLGASLAVTKGGTGTWALTNGNNSYTGVTTDGAGGTLSVSVLANGGSNSSIGASSNVAANLVISGSSTFQYNGSGSSTDRLFTIATGTSTLDSSGTGAVNFTNPGSIAFTATSARTLVFAGTNTGNNTFNPVLGNPSNGALSVTKSGAGTWILTGNNTFTGATTINAGILNAGANGALGSGTTGTSGITVNSGGSLVLSNASASDRVKDTAPITLGTTSGASTATIARSSGGNEGLNNTVGLGALTLAANASLNYGGATVGNGTLTFASFTPSTFTLSILGYDGVFGTTTQGVDGTNDRLIFNADQSANLTQFSFINPDGLTGTYGADEINLGGGFFEIVPVPEPSTWGAAALAAAVIGYSFSARRKRAVPSC